MVQDWSQAISAGALQTSRQLYANSDSCQGTSHWQIAMRVTQHSEMRVKAHPLLSCRLREPEPPVTPSAWLCFAPALSCALSMLYCSAICRTAWPVFERAEAC